MFWILIGTLIHLVIFEKKSYLASNFPKLVVIGFGFAFSQLNCKLQQATITKAKYFNQYTLSNMLSCLFINFALIVVCYLRIFSDSLFLDSIIAISLVLNTLSWFTYAYRLAHEIADILGINILTIGKRKLH